MTLNFTHSSAPLKTIEEIQFGLLSPDEIKAMSVCHIEYPETMVSCPDKPGGGEIVFPTNTDPSRRTRTRRRTNHEKRD